MNKKNKTFDCVEMKRQGALRVHEILKGMTVRQQIEYWRQQSELMRQRQAKARAGKSSPEDSPASRP